MYLKYRLWAVPVIVVALLHICFGAGLRWTTPVHAALFGIGSAAFDETADTTADKTADDSQKKATLVIEGESVVSISLFNVTSGWDKVYNNPKTIHLPPGTYSVQQVTLEGDYSSSNFPWPTVDLMPGETQTLKYGAPLHPTVTIERSGNILTLDYKCQDAEGHVYQYNGPNSYESPPGFSIFIGDKEVDSGKFAYG